MSVYSLGHFFNWIFAVFLRFYSFQTLSPFFSLFYATAANPYSNHHPIDESVLSFSSVNNRDNRIVHVTLSTRLKGSRIRKRKEVSGIAITGFTSRVFFFFLVSLAISILLASCVVCSGKRSRRMKKYQAKELSLNNRDNSSDRRGNSWVKENREKKKNRTNASPNIPQVPGNSGKKLLKREERKEKKL